MDMMILFVESSTEYIQQGTFKSPRLPDRKLDNRIIDNTVDKTSSKRARDHRQYTHKHKRD